MPIVRHDGPAEQMQIGSGMTITDSFRPALLRHAKVALCLLPARRNFYDFPTANRCQRRTMNASNCPCVITELHAGQTLYAAVDAGTAVRVTAGRVRLDEAPRWIAGLCAPAGRTLAEGDRHVVESAGCIRITALGGAARWHREPPGAGLAARALQWLLQQPPPARRIGQGEIP
ncbi:MAG: hypothetical protein EOO24_32905 [Comamonadaceae bacterium]|nr:MAG: hypothetical protein EOO24_32905 [Comamonadaceae bacterium]